MHTFSALFQKNSLVFKDCKALKYRAKQYTYKVLDRHSNQLAHYLLQHGVTKNSIVAIISNNYLERIVCIISLWKLGAAYVPIDPEYPIKRINFILEDAKIKFAILDSHKDKKKGILECVTSIFLDQANYIGFSASPPFDLEKNNANDIAYIAYTSGSTGQPKGVVVTQANIMSIFKAWKETYKLTHCDIHLQMANFGFDVCSGDIIRAFGSGAQLIISNSKTIQAPEKLYKLLKKESINIAEFTPPVLRSLINYLDKQKLNLYFMRLLICGSDCWNLKEYKKFSSFLNSTARLINSYGTTEATIDSTYFETKEVIQEEDEQKLVPLGRPFPNTIIKILDENGVECPIGVSGEIYIGGAGVTLGYINKPELTSERFIAIPRLSNGKSNIFYRTGDLGVYANDGNIHFLGRFDCQIKVMGHRVSLLEIESTLKKSPGIHDAVIVPHIICNITNEVYLVAFIIEEKYFDKKIFLEFIKLSLPSYALPVLYFSISDFPISKHGKLDRLYLKNNLKNINKATGELKDQSNKAMEAKVLALLRLVFNTQFIDYNNAFFYLKGSHFLQKRFLNAIKASHKFMADETDLTTLHTLQDSINLLKKFKIKMQELDYAL